MDNTQESLLAEIEKLNNTISGVEETSKLLVKRDIELRRAYDSLKSLDREKTEFVSIAAHQLRTPVTTARWAMQELTQKLINSLSEDDIKLLQRSSDSIERIFNLTEDLLELNRIDFGNTSIHPAPGSIEMLLESIHKDHEPQLEKRLISVEKNYATHPPSTSFDPIRMRDVLDNIFDNAIKYTSVGGTITIKTTYKDNSAYIEVCDTGIGIEKGFEEKIFQKFTRLGNAESVDPNGIGLGLYVARSIIESHQGTITYTHNLPQGSIFTIRIPC